MNKAVGIGIGIAVAVIAFVVAGGSTMLVEQGGLPYEDDNTMTMGDKVSVSVQPADEDVVEESTEGKSLEVKLVDGISATSTP